MNHLAHFKVAHPDPGLIVGGFLGDFVKGRLAGEFPTTIEEGIRLHRAVDAFSDRHEVTRQSVRRFAPEFRRVGPIMVDVIYDHFLARQWATWSDEPLADFADDVLAMVEHRHQTLPERARRTAERMREARSLEHYANDAFIDRSFRWLSTRLTRDNPLADGFGEFKRLERELVEDFELFFPDLEIFASEWQVERMTKH